MPGHLHLDMDFSTRCTTTDNYTETCQSDSSVGIFVIISKMLVPAKIGEDADLTTVAFAGCEGTRVGEVRLVRSDWWGDGRGC